MFSAGTATQTGMGLVPLSWTEIKAWVDCYDLADTVSPWELILIRKLSEEYCAEYHRASDVRRPEPYLPVVENVEEVRDKVANQLASIFSGYTKIKG